MKRLSPIALLLLTSTPAWALDSTEPFDLGFSNYEMYVGTSGLGGPADERLIAWSSVIGVGVTERFSASLSYVAEADESFGKSAEGLVAGLYGTVVDTQRFDFDLYGNISTEAGVAVGTELNFDPARWGIQLTLEQSFSDDPDGDDVLRQLVVAPLFLFSVTPDVELLAGVDFTTASNHPDVETVEFGVIAMGVNVILNDAVELITEFHVHPGAAGEDVTFGASVGFVATVPAR